jgi:branched-chain amino acid transport system ATP-binding protein
MSAVLEVDNISTYYGLSRALFGVSLTVGRGQCVCLLGRNGVGKSTVMRSIIGLSPPAEGSVVFEGTPIQRWRTDRIARAGVGFVPEDRRVFGELTVLENLEVARRAARRAGRWTVEAVWALFPKLETLRDRRAGNLSGGEQQMLTIARTLMCNPELLLLDEPSEGLAPLVVESLLEQVGRLKAEGLTILLAEQGVGFSLALADRVYVLEKGAVVHEGPAAELRDDAALRNRLLTL